MRLIVLPLLLVMACDPEVDIADPENAPVATVLAPSEGAEIATGSVTFLGRVSDEETAADLLFATWSLGDASGGRWRDVCRGFALEDGSTQCTTEVEAEDAQVRLSVVDLAGYRGLEIVGLAVRVVEPPVLSLVAPDTREQHFANLPVRLEAQVQDADHDPDELEVVWHSDVVGRLDGPEFPDATGMLRGSVQLPGGEHRIVVTAEDPDGAVDRAEVVLWVAEADAPPRLSQVSPTVTAVRPDEPVTLTVRARDDHSDPEEIEVRWSSDLDGDLGPASLQASGEHELVVDDLSAGEHRLTAVAVDAQGQQAELSVDLIVDPAPSLEVLCPQADQMLPAGENIDVLVEVDDAPAEAEGLQVVLWSDVQGDLGTMEVGEDGHAWTRTSLVPGTHALVLTVTDAVGLQGTVARLVTVEAEAVASCPEAADRL